MDKSKPLLNYLILCEDVSIGRNLLGEDKLTIIQPLSNILTDNLPLVVTLGIVFSVSNLLPRSKYNVQMRIVNERGTELSSQSYEMPAEINGSETSSITSAGGIKDMEFEGPGFYKFELSLDGNFIGEQVLEIKKRLN
ncbi:hypothetical protein MHH60_26520 [Paenibacillus sp. FSL H7-0716]|uniref:Uncharacterized protein n=1 Tax=Paenibacillus odorifer TaxID=189426 RepID=A0AB36J4R1_9BACL|nr:hypothetical protein [Paenibacillus odorifer]OME08064.1 hypothetical protein BSK60_30730 [Paenibacillus odorifer]OME11230.1 hypothetical protein BSK47_29500 [Paenibacillus odorifer]